MEGETQKMIETVNDGEVLSEKNWELEIRFLSHFGKILKNIAGMLKGIKPGRKVKKKGQQAANKELKEIMECSPELCQAARGGPGETAGHNKWS